MQLLAPAKINLYLRVGPLGADGYEGFHPLVSWIVTVGLFDTLNFDRTEAEGLRFTCDDTSLPTDDRNIVVRATHALLAQRTEPSGSAAGSSSRPDGASIVLNKNIPHAAGLGGGSSDAAATLIGLNALLDLKRTDAELLRIGAALGSDVPFFFAAPSAVCTGRGEVVRRTPPPVRARWAVLLFPALGLSTARVYQAFDARPFGKAGAGVEPDWREQPDWQQWASLSSDALLPRLVNDLESPAFAVSPELADLRDRAERALSRVVRMSGSGSTLFTLFDDEPAARSAAEQLVRDLGIRATAVPVAPH